MMRRKQLSVLLTVLILTMTVTAGCGGKKEDAAVLPDTEEVMAVVDTEMETEEPTEAVEETEEAESTELTEAVEETEVMESTEAQTAEADADGYTYETLDQTMYAKSQVNVRNKPFQVGEKLGALKANEEVKVTGKCNETGWYRISYAGSTGYVSDKYLTDTKTSTQASKNTGTSKNTNSSAGKNSASTGTASGTGNGSTSGTTASNGSNSGSQTASGNGNNGGSNASGGNNGGSSTPAQTPSDNGGNSTPSTPDSGNNGGNTTPSTPDNGGSTGVDLSTGGSNYNMSLDGIPTPPPEAGGSNSPDLKGDDSDLVMGGGTFEIN